MSVRIASIVALLSLGLLFTACQPKDTRPGFWLKGERAEELIQDWRFTEDVEEIFVETRTWYGVRHSTTIWCVDLDGLLYIGSYDDDVKYWEKNVARNPAARLRIQGQIYDVTVTPVAPPIQPRPEASGQRPLKTHTTAPRMRPSMAKASNLLQKPA